MPIPRSWGQALAVVGLPDQPPVIQAGLGVEDGVKKAKRSAKAWAQSKSKSRPAA